MSGLHVFIRRRNKLSVVISWSFNSDPHEGGRPLSLQSRERSHRRRRCDLDRGFVPSTVMTPLANPLNTLFRIANFVTSTSGKVVQTRWNLTHM
uniref:AlNc14C62G4498 protein n=1 Tax=Albugo laibachii Nc14 TaxID=890382 RepID=F0WCX3_9STRA|nr:AlNc14C62G4498 [Albugo laibachii Nc14]|eukprot:CCA19044.1 AlNc14C62G4498 [Albugo laibachii Nc14]